MPWVDGWKPSQFSNMVNHGRNIHQLQTTMKKKKKHGIKTQRHVAIRKLGTEDRPKETENEIKCFEDNEEIIEEQHGIEGEDNRIEEEGHCSGNWRQIPIVNFFLFNFKRGIRAFTQRCLAP